MVVQEGSRDAAAQERVLRALSDAGLGPECLGVHTAAAAQAHHKSQTVLTRPHALRTLKDESIFVASLLPALLGRLLLGRLLLGS